MEKVWRETASTQRGVGDYHDLYLRTDVLFLDDVFVPEAVRLRPAHYYTALDLSWDTLLKKTGVELELPTDYDMCLITQKGIRGRFSMVSKRYEKASDPLVDGYDLKKSKWHILYLAVNNLHGWEICMPQPICDGFNGSDPCQRRNKSETKGQTRRRA